METRSKRRRLMSISSHVSLRPRPDVPATFESLNDDTLGLVLEFVGNKSYATYARINKHCKAIYLTTPGVTKETFLYGYGPLSVIKDSIERAMRGQFNWEVFYAVGKGVVLYNRHDVLDWALEERNEYVLKEACYVAGREDMFDILEEVWNYIDDRYVKERIFGGLHDYGAGGGKLNVLKWFETKGFDINIYGCAYLAASRGQLHILRWLKEEKGLKLFRDLYIKAINDDGHLHIMKWLREQGCPWSEFYTFSKSAEVGNLDILQWLHDEGCPWPDYIQVREDRVTPEVVNWCRTNGYGNRLL